MTLKQLIKVIMGFRLIPPDYVVPIERDGQVVRLEGPGYVRKNPLTEQYGRMIRTGFGAKQLALEDVRSADGDPVSIRAKLLYNFNPCLGEEKVALALIQDEVEETLGQIIQDEGEKAIRHTVGDFKTEELRSGKTWEQLERSIGRRLRHTLAKFGVAPVDPNWVAFTHISLPIKLEKAYENFAEQKVTAEAQKTAAEALKVIAEAWAAMSSEGAKRMITADIYEKLANGNGTIQVISSPADLLGLPLQLLGREMSVPVAVKQNGKSLSES